MDSELGPQTKPPDCGVSVCLAQNLVQKLDPVLGPSSTNATVLKPPAAEQGSDWLRKVVAMVLSQGSSVPEAAVPSLRFAFGEAHNSQ